MPIWIAALLGAVQGFSEFLPISSSGHLALLQNWLNVEQYGADGVLFSTVLHLGTLVAVCVAFWGDIVALVRGLLGLFFDRFAVRERPERRLVVLLILGTLPLVAGAFLEGLISSAFESTLFVGCALLVTAALLFVATRVVPGHDTEASARYPKGFFVGLMQLIAIFPGISRSGATICGGLFCGFSRAFAVRFAFLLSIPAVLGAVVFQLPELLGGGMVATDWPAYLVGFLVSAVCGYCAIWLVRTLMKRNSFQWFALYCAVMGLVSIVTSLL